MMRGKRSPTGLLSDSFDEMESLLSRDLMEDMSSTPPLKKVVYTNLDERSSVEAMPIYIRVGNVSYTTTTPPLDEASVNYFGGDSEGGACPIIMNPANIDEVVPINGDFLIIKNMINNFGHEVTFDFVRVRFQNGCLIEVYDVVYHQCTFTQKNFTICGGSTTAVYDVHSDDFEG